MGQINSRVSSCLKQALLPCRKTCCSGVVPSESVIPTWKEVNDAVTGHIPDMAKNYATYVNNYKLGMRARAPKSYTCKEVLCKDSSDGKLHLKLGRDDEKQVKTAALLAATNQDVRSRIKDDVWEELEPSVKEDVEKIPWANANVKARMLKGARKSTDLMVDKVIDKLFDKWAEKIKRGEDPFMNHGTASF